VSTRKQGRGNIADDALQMRGGYARHLGLSTNCDGRRMLCYEKR